MTAGPEMPGDPTPDRPRGRRLRIASLVHGVGGRESGVRRLILDQAAAWARLDPTVDVGLFVRCEAGMDAAWRGELHVVGVTSSRFGIVGRYLVREVLSVRLALWRPDVIYLRHSTVSPSLFLLALAFPMVIGGDLDDLDELRIRSPLRYWYARLVRDRLLRRARRIVVVTHEIARQPALVRLGRPVSVLPNSIDLADYPELPAPANVSPRLVFLGAPNLAWAGIDKLARLAAAFPGWRFDVVGSGPGAFPDGPANLVAHGQLDRAEYLPIMAEADVAIGPLALHRKGLSEASALKVAEYLAYGIPVILANAETAFPEGAPFLLRLPNTEDNVDTSIEAVREFVERWRGRRVPRAAVAPVDTSVVERARLDMLVGVTADGTADLGRPTSAARSR